MKNYKKHTTKLLQVRLTVEEYDDVLEFIHKFGATRREVILALLKINKGMNILREGKFYSDQRMYAYDKTRETVPLFVDDMCEICENKRAALRHHHDGYDGENANKVHKLCDSCHGTLHGFNFWDKTSFEEIKDIVLLRKEARKYPDPRMK